jgi:YidC/Oxa1 family membrane protein insertase
MATLLQPLMSLEQWVLEGLHAVGLAWGLAIVALTVLVRLSLLPLAMRQRSAGIRAAVHAPQLKALRERHREDATTMRVELAAYRKRHGLTVRGGFAGFALQILIVWSLALLLRDDAASGTFGGASWLFVPDLSEPASGSALALLLGGWIAVQLASLRLAARVGRRRVVITLLAPIPLLFAAAHIPAGILIYLLVSAAFGVAQKLALRARMPVLSASPPERMRESAIA